MKHELELHYVVKEERPATSSNVVQFYPRRSPETQTDIWELLVALGNKMFGKDGSR